MVYVALSYVKSFDQFQLHFLWDERYFQHIFERIDPSLCLVIYRQLLLSSSDIYLAMGSRVLEILVLCRSLQFTARTDCDSCLPRILSVV